MTEEIVPSGTPTPTEGTNWEASYKSLQKKYNDLHGTTQSLIAEKSTAEAQLSNIQSVLSTKETEWKTVQAQTTAQMQETAATLQRTQAEQKAAQANLAKFQALAAFDANPTVKAGLMKLVDKIPTADDPAAQLDLIKQFADFGNTVATAREQELRTGVTPGFAGATTTPTAPTTADAWKTALATEKPGSDRYKAVQTQWFEWARKQK